ncbi:class A beta-lactamase [Nocardioides marmotae]|uniref:class A beta-lactamase n=1 Tax=Nocardioides marmotae TaxID=2663857 RepID=UPI0014956E6A|nr:class A beta-lactamase [Nocardioides marmotae]QKE02858.1 class A beta-lactamase [Nocardioides marmotae]
MRTCPLPLRAGGAGRNDRSHASGGTVIRLTIAVAAVLLLVACSSGSEPTPEPSSEPSSGPTPSSPSSSAPAVAAAPIDRRLAALEERYDARVGVSLLDTGDGAAYSYRGDQRFGFASSVKVLVAAELLRRTGSAERAELVRWTQDDVDAAGYSPVTEAHVDRGLPLLRLAEAAVRESDNTATNLVLERLDGPAGLTRGLLGRGDTTTVLADDEPGLNEVSPGSPANTTTPDAFVADLRALLGPEWLTDADRRLLLGWMSGNPGGDPLIRAGAPAGWRVAQKSGGAGPVRNDVAVLTPPDGRAPVLLAVLTTRLDPSAPYDDALVADAAEVALGALEAS